MSQEEMRRAAAENAARYRDLIEAKAWRLVTSGILLDELLLKHELTAETYEATFYRVPIIGRVYYWSEGAPAWVLN